METSPEMSAYVTTWSPSQYKNTGKQKHNDWEGRGQAVPTDDLIVYAENSKKSNQKLYPI